MIPKLRMNLIYPSKPKPKTHEGEWEFGRYIKCFLYKDSRNKRSRRPVFNFEFSENDKVIPELKEIKKIVNGQSGETSLLLYIHHDHAKIKKMVHLILGIK